MKIKVLLVMSSLFVTSLGNSQSLGLTFRFGMGEQKGDAVIFKKDKQKVSGIVDFPDFTSKKVKIKVGENSEKYESADIDSIQIFDADKKLSYTFIWTKTKTYKKKGTEFKVIKENWLCKTISGKASLYLGGEEYGLKQVKVENEDSKEKAKVVQMKVVSKEVYHYLKRSNEDYPILVSMSSNALSAGYNAFFREFGVYYFSDKPEIATKIENKEYKYDDLEKVVGLYNAKSEKKVQSKSALKATKMKITPPDSKTKTTKKK